MAFMRLTIWQHRILLLILLGIGLNYFGTVGVAKASNANVKTLQVIGGSRIYNENILSARKHAVNDSLSSAIRAAAVELLPVDSLIRDFPILNEVVFKKIAPFIQSYKVLTEFRYKTEYRVLVHVIILVDEIMQQMEAVGVNRGEGKLPRILFLIAEQISPDTSPQYWWSGNPNYSTGAGETSMSEIMRKKGFPVVYHNLLPKARVSRISGRTYLSDAQAIQIGLALKADVVIKGSTGAQIAFNVMQEDVQSFKGIIKIEALRTDNRKQIAAGVYTAIGADSDKNAGRRNAIYRAGTPAGEEFALKLAEEWQKKAVHQPALIDVVVTGTGNLSYFVQFRRVLNLIKGVRGMQMKEIKSDESTISVDYESSAGKLADELMFNDFEFFGINISKVSEDVLNIAIVPVASSSDSRLKEHTISDKQGSYRFHKIKP
jgi:hypothetical protein